MKWLNFLLICVAVLVMNACEKHSASELNLIRMQNEAPAPAPAEKSAEQAAPAASARPAPGVL